MSEAQPSSQQVAESQAAVSHATKVAKAAVPLETLVREFGEQAVTSTTAKPWREGGDWNVHLEGREQVERFEEMDQQRSRLDETAGDAELATRREVTVRDRHGRDRLMPEAVAGSLGLAPRPYWGRPKYRVRYVNGERVETRFQ